MPSRRRSWKPYRPAPTEEARVPGLVAHARTVSDLVECFACVAFLNDVSSPSSRNDLLRATAVYTVRHLTPASPVATIMFRTASQAFPVKANCPPNRFVAAGSSFAFHIVHNDPSSVPAFMRLVSECPQNEAGSLDDIQACAVNASATVIQECIDGNCLAFKDAVASRFKFFVKSHLRAQSTTSRSTPPPLPKADAPDAPFVKPEFATLDELLPHFALDNNKLVFCHEISLTTRCLVALCDDSYESDGDC